VVFDDVAFVAVCIDRIGRRSLAMPGLRDFVQAA